MASASHLVVSTRASFPATHVHINKSLKAKGSGIGFFSVKASSEQELDCNAEDCAPDKEVGKVSVEWLANEKTKVVGTYPPRKRGWTGYVEKDTAGQTNIYSVEPTVYVADSAISSGNAGTSSDGTGSTVTTVAGLALLSVALGSAILLQLGKSPDVQSSYSYSGPPLSYYINKFKTQVVETSSILAELPESPAPISDEFQQETLPEEPNSQVTDNS